MATSDITNLILACVGIVFAGAILYILYGISRYLRKLVQIEERRDDEAKRQKAERIEASMPVSPLWKKDLYGVAFEVQPPSLEATNSGSSQSTV
jgi:hypothetical protein